jgi:hypothetical protein
MIVSHLSASKIGGLFGYGCECMLGFFDVHFKLMDIGDVCNIGKLLSNLDANWTSGMGYGC